MGLSRLGLALGLVKFAPFLIVTIGVGGALGPCILLLGVNELAFGAYGGLLRGR